MWVKTPRGKCLHTSGDCPLVRRSRDVCTVDDDAFARHDVCEHCTRGRACDICHADGSEFFMCSHHSVCLDCALNLFANGSQCPLDHTPIREDKIKSDRLRHLLRMRREQEAQADDEAPRGGGRRARDTLSAMDPLEHLVERVMTLRCPRCDKAFVDFDACAALFCECDASFCGLCLTECAPHDVHAHVRDCPHRPPDMQRGYFVDFASWSGWQTARRLRACGDAIRIFGTRTRWGALDVARRLCRIDEDAFWYLPVDIQCLVALTTWRVAMRVVTRCVTRTLYVAAWCVDAAWITWCVWQQRLVAVAQSGFARAS